MPRDDGRYFAQYAADHCVCAYCWSPLVQIWDEDDQRWKAVCSDEPAHIGYHHQAFKSAQIDRHAIDSLDICEFYRESGYANAFGLTPRLQGRALQDRFQQLRAVMRGDDSAL